MLVLLFLLQLFIDRFLLRQLLFELLNLWLTFIIYVVFNCLSFLGAAYQSFSSRFSRYLAFVRWQNLSVNLSLHVFLKFEVWNLSISVCICCCVLVVDSSLHKVFIGTFDLLEQLGELPAIFFINYLLEGIVSYFQLVLRRKQLWWHFLLEISQVNGQGSVADETFALSIGGLSRQCHCGDLGVWVARVYGLLCLLLRGHLAVGDVLFVQVVSIWVVVRREWCVERVVERKIKIWLDFSVSSCISGWGDKILMLVKCRVLAIRYDELLPIWFRCLKQELSVDLGNVFVSKFQESLVGQIIGINWVLPLVSVFLGQRWLGLRGGALRLRMFRHVTHRLRSLVLVWSKFHVFQRNDLLAGRLWKCKLVWLRDGLFYLGESGLGWRMIIWLDSRVYWGVLVLYLNIGCGCGRLTCPCLFWRGAIVKAGNLWFQVDLLNRVGFIHREVLVYVTRCDIFSLSLFVADDVWHPGVDFCGTLSIWTERDVILVLQSSVDNVCYRFAIGEALSVGGIVALTSAVSRLLLLTTIWIVCLDEVLAATVLSSTLLSRQCRLRRMSDQLWGLVLLLHLVSLVHWDIEGNSSSWRGWNAVLELGRALRILQGVKSDLLIWSDSTVILLPCLSS